MEKIKFVNLCNCMTKLIIIDFVVELNFFSLFSRIYLNNISSYIGPIIPDDINNINNGMLVVI